MKIRPTLLLLCLFASAPVLSPVALANDPDAPAAVDEKDTKKNTSIIEVSARLEAVHAAALEALASVGAKVKKDAADHIEAKRSNKMGIAVGSGGEKLFVTLKDLGDGKVQVTVVTKKTMLGYVGQKLWNEEVAAHIRDAIK